MYPFFILGYLFFNYDIFSKLLKFKFITILVASIFLVCLITCDSSNFMYVKPQLLDIWNSNNHFIGLFKYYGFMILAGLSGIYLSYFAILKFTEYSKLFALLKDVGKYTFAIYMMQGIIFNSICKYYAINLEYHIIAFIVSLIITYLLYKFSKVISKVKYLNFLVGK